MSFLTLISLLQSALLLMGQIQSDSTLSEIDRSSLLQSAQTAIVDASKSFTGTTADPKVTDDAEDAQGYLYSATAVPQESTSTSVSTQASQEMELVFNSESVVKSAFSLKDTPRFMAGTLMIKNAPIDVRVQQIDATLETSDLRQIPIAGYSTLNKFPSAGDATRGNLVLNFGFKGKEFSPEGEAAGSRPVAITLTRIVLVDAAGKTYEINGPIYLPQINLIYTSNKAAVAQSVSIPQSTPSAPATLDSVSQRTSSQQMTIESPATDSAPQLPATSTAR